MNESDDEFKINVCLIFLLLVCRRHRVRCAGVCGGGDDGVASPASCMTSQPSQTRPEPPPMTRALTGIRPGSSSTSHFRFHRGDAVTLTLALS